MNGRIKELAKQAGFAMKIDDDPNSPPGWWGAGHDPTFEKFAELIVRECAKVINADIEYQIKDGIISNVHGLNQARNLIKEHFGVEE